jgi:hypothetical protein
MTEEAFAAPAAIMRSAVSEIAILWLTAPGIPARRLEGSALVFVGFRRRLRPVIVLGG